MSHTFHILPHIQLTNDFLVGKEVLNNLPVPLVFVDMTREIVWKNRFAGWVEMRKDSRRELLHQVFGGDGHRRIPRVQLASGAEVTVESQPVRSLGGTVEGYLLWVSDNLAGLAGDFLETGLAVAEDGRFILVNAVAESLLGPGSAGQSWDQVSWLPRWHVAMRRGHRTFFALAREEFEIRIHAHYPWVMVEAIPAPIIDSDRISAQLASAVMHEVRNPLSALSGYIELAQMQLAPGPARAHLDRAMAEIDRLSRLTADFMSLSRSTEIRKQWCPLTPLVEKAWSVVQSGGEYGPDVQVKPLMSSQDRIFADPDRFEQILINALKNAAEAFTAPGVITVAVSRSADGQRVTIADNGPGMPAEVMETLFVKRRTTKAQGHGLGLLIIKQLAEVHGGVVQVTSQKGEGTEIAITLPYPDGPTLETSPE